PELLKMVANMTDDDIWRLTRGGHDPHKIYAAFKNAQENKGSPTVLLVKTVKGFGMGKSGEARNTAHQTKKLDDEAIREMRDRFAIPITQAYVRTITALLKDQTIGQRIVPILVDESRTFGMEGLFRQIGIFNQQGQLYEPVDKDQVMYYREDKAGQILQEGINEAG